MLYTKHIKTLVTSGALALACSSCSSSFLEKEPTQYVSPEQLSRATQWNPNILLGQTAVQRSLYLIHSQLQQAVTMTSDKKRMISIRIFSAGIWRLRILSMEDLGIRLVC